MFWTQFAIQVLTGAVSPQFGGRGGRRSWRLVALNSPVVTSYRLLSTQSNHGLSLTVFAVLRIVTDRQTDGQTELLKSVKFFMGKPSQNYGMSPKYGVTILLAARHNRATPP